METRLSQETVVDSAIGLVDAEGLDALTIRRLAQRQGVTPMALYWHFKSKDDLLLAVAARLWDGVDSRPGEPGLPPLDRLRALMDAVLTVMRAHPHAIPLLVRPGATLTGGCFEAMEAALSIFAELGLGIDHAGQLVSLALQTLTSLVSAEPGAARAGLSAEEAAEESRLKRVGLRSLPPARYPRIIAAADSLTCAKDPDEWYDLGVELFVRGVADLARVPAGS